MVITAGPYHHTAFKHSRNTIAFRMQIKPSRSSPVSCYKTKQLL